MGSLGQSLSELGEEIQRTGNADPAQLGSVLRRVGEGVSRLERELEALLDRVEGLESALRQARARERASKFTD